MAQSQAAFQAQNRRKAIYKRAQELMAVLKLLKPEQWSYYGTYIDSEFFFKFDTGWLRRVHAIRRHFFGQSSPLSNDIAAANAIKSLDQKSKNEIKAIDKHLYQYSAATNNAALLKRRQYLTRNAPLKPGLVRQKDLGLHVFGLHLQFEYVCNYLAAKYGLVNIEDVRRHILLGDKVYWPYLVTDGLRKDEGGLQYLGLRVYSVPTLRALEKAPLTGLGNILFPPNERNRIFSSLLDSGGSVPKAFKAMDGQNRIRTWVIYLLSQDGGGDYKQYQAVTNWNATHKILAIAPTTYGTQKKKLLDKVKFHLNKVEEINKARQGKP